MADRQTEMRLMLRSLRLPAIAAQYEDLALKAAKANLTHESYLHEHRHCHAVERRRASSMITRCPGVSDSMDAGVPYTASVTAAGAAGTRLRF